MKGVAQMNEDYYDNLDKDMDDIRKIGVCEECDEDIYDDNTEIYISKDGYYFCCLECALRFYGIQKAEDSMVSNKD